VSSINTWKSVYYAFKVSVAVFTAALKDIAPYEIPNDPVERETEVDRPLLRRRRNSLVAPLRRARREHAPAAATVESAQPTPGKSV
jgi:hypothetical protein